MSWKSSSPQYPISFALNLAVPPDKAIKEQAKAVPCTKPDPGKNDPNKDKPKGDEADSSRTKVSQASILQCVRNGVTAGLISET